MMKQHVRRAQKTAGVKALFLANCASRFKFESFGNAPKNLGKRSPGLSDEGTRSIMICFVHAVACVFSWQLSYALF